MAAAGVTSPGAAAPRPAAVTGRTAASASSASAWRAPCRQFSRAISGRYAEYRPEPAKVVGGASAWSRIGRHAVDSAQAGHCLYRVRRCIRKLRGLPEKAAVVIMHSKTWGRNDEEVSCIVDGLDKPLILLLCQVEGFRGYRTRCQVGACRGHRCRQPGPWWWCYA